MKILIFTCFSFLILSCSKAKEIKENGLKVGEMNNLLLQKIEELTLLLIEQNKKMSQQDVRINELEAKK